MLGNANINDTILRAYIDQVFQKYDTDKSGDLDQQQLTLFFSDLWKILKIPGQITKQNAKQAIKSMDHNSNGTIDKSELFNAFKILMSKQSMPNNNMYQPQYYQPYPYPQYGPGYYPQMYPPQNPYSYPYQQPMYGSFNQPQQGNIYDPYVNNPNPQAANGIGNAMKGSMRGGTWSKRNKN